MAAINIALFAADNEGSVEDILRNNAQNGDVFSQVKLGEEFLYGINRTRNLNLAFYYFNMAANQGSKEGIFYIAFCYEYGYGVPKNEIRAYQYYEKAIELDEAKFKGTANQQRIISGYLENKLFPLPPKAEQDRIAYAVKQTASIMSR